MTEWSKALFNLSRSAWRGFESRWRHIFSFRIFRSLPVQKHRHDVTMIYDRWNHSQDQPKKLPNLSYTHDDKTGRNFWTLSPNSAPFEIKTQWNGITCIQLTSPKVPHSKTIHDQLRLFRYIPLVQLFMYFPATAPESRFSRPILTFTLKC